MATQIQVRRDTAANWTSSNPILAQGEQGLETDTGKVKFGDGTSTWSALPYSGSGQLAIDDLTDVDTTGVVGGDVLKWNGTTWTPTTDDDSTPNLDQVTTQGNTTTNAITVGSATVTNGLTVDGTTLVVDDTNNLVGIGTASPGYNLTVENAGGSSTLGVIAATTGQSIINLGDTSNGVVGQVSYDHTDNSMRFNTAAAERMRIDVSGNVGIGTDSPNRTLTVSSASGVPAELISSSTNSLLAFFDAGTGVRPSIGSAGSDIVFNVNSSERMRIDSSGNVGIGTAAPATALHVDVGTSNDALRLVSTDAQTNILMGDNAGSVRLQNDGGAFVAYSGTSSFSGFAERMRIDSSGNVGIGLASPSTKLHMLTNNSSCDIRLQSGGVGNDTSVEFVSRNLSNVAAYATIAADASHSSSNAPITFSQGASPVERMRIDSNGNVGIGATAPFANLSVLGDTYMAGFARDVDVGSVGPAGSYIGVGARAGATVYYGAAFGSLLTSATDGDAIIQTMGSGGLTEKVRIDSSGNVGIGTSSPSSRLEIAGNLAIYGTRGSDNVLRFFDNSSGSDAEIAQVWGDDLTNALTFFSTSGNGVNFRVNGSSTVSASIDTSGNLLVGTTSASGKLNAGGKISSVAATAGTYYEALYSGVTFVNQGFTGIGGTWQVVNSSGGVDLAIGATSWAAASDETLKENISDIGPVLDTIKDFQCVNYSLKASESEAADKVGFIAQDWEHTFPNVVDKDEDGKLSMRYTETIPVLLKAIQELKAEVEALKNA